GISFRLKAMVSPKGGASSGIRGLWAAGGFCGAACARSGANAPAPAKAVANVRRLRFLGLDSRIHFPNSTIQLMGLDICIRRRDAGAASEHPFPSRMVINP